MFVRCSGRKFCHFCKVPSTLTFCGNETRLWLGDQPLGPEVTRVKPQQDDRVQWFDRRPVSAHHLSLGRWLLLGASGSDERAFQHGGMRGCSIFQSCRSGRSSASGGASASRCCLRCPLLAQLSVAARSLVRLLSQAMEGKEREIKRIGRAGPNCHQVLAAGPRVRVRVRLQVQGACFCGALQAGRTQVPTCTFNLRLYLRFSLHSLGSDAVERSMEAADEEPPSANFLE